jgi:hypothetical protein
LATDEAKDTSEANPQTNSKKRALIFARHTALFSEKRFRSLSILQWVRVGSRGGAKFPACFSHFYRTLYPDIVFRGNKF